MKKITLFLSGIFSLTMILIISCSKTSEDRIAASGNFSCDTTAVSYSLSIVPILVENCYSCHGAGSNGGSGGIIIEGYDNLLKWANNGFLGGNVTHTPGYVPMPYGRDKLPDCEVNKIVAWINQGSKNN